MRNVSFGGGFGKEAVSFRSDGTLSSVELKIMNLRPGVLNNLVWEEVYSPAGIKNFFINLENHKDRPYIWRVNTCGAESKSI